MSLVTTPTHSLTTCQQCCGTRVTHITMTLTDGSLVDFNSCHTCEHKSWTQAGTGLAVADVLRKAQKAKRAA
jgi:predicted metal-binding protein